MSDKLFWREKGTKQWREGFDVEHNSNMIKIGPYRGADRGLWYDREDIETKER